MAEASVTTCPDRCIAIRARTADNPPSLTAHAIMSSNPPRLSPRALPGLTPAPALPQAQSHTPSRSKRCLLAWRWPPRWLPSGIWHPSAASVTTGAGTYAHGVVGMWLQEKPFTPRGCGLADSGTAWWAWFRHRSHEVQDHRPTPHFWQAVWSAGVGHESAGGGLVWLQSQYTAMVLSERRTRERHDTCGYPVSTAGWGRHCAMPGAAGGTGGV